MAMAGLKLDVFGLPEFVKGLERSKKLSIRFMRGEFKRGGKRVVKAFKQQQLSGPPGIEGGQLKKGKSVRSHVYGDDPSNIGVQVGISRLLDVHELGMTIRAKGGGKLLLRKRSKGTRKLFTRGSKEQGEIIAVTDQVVIPKRLHFKELAKSMAPEIQKKAAQAAVRGTEVAMQESTKRVVGRLVGAL